MIIREVSSSTVWGRMVPSASFGSKNVFFSNIEGRMLSDGTSFELVVCLLFKKDTIVSILFIFEKKDNNVDPLSAQNWALPIMRVT